MLGPGWFLSFLVISCLGGICCSPVQGPGKHTDLHSKDDVVHTQEHSGVPLGKTVAATGAYDQHAILTSAGPGWGNDGENTSPQGLGQGREVTALRDEGQVDTALQGEGPLNITPQDEYFVRTSDGDDRKVLRIGQLAHLNRSTLRNEDFVRTTQQNKDLREATRENRDLVEGERENKYLRETTHENKDLVDTTRENKDLREETRKSKDLVEGERENKDLVEGTGENKDLVEGERENNDLRETTRENKDLVETTRENKDLVEETGENKDLVEATRKNKDLIETTQENIVLRNRTQKILALNVTTKEKIYFPQKPEENQDSVLEHAGSETLLHKQHQGQGQTQSVHVDQMKTTRKDDRHLRQRIALDEDRKDVASPRPHLAHASSDEDVTSKRRESEGWPLTSPPGGRLGEAKDSNSEPAYQWSTKGPGGRRPRQQLNSSRTESLSEEGGVAKAIGLVVGGGGGTLAKAVLQVQGHVSETETPRTDDPPTHPDDLYGAVTSPDREDPPTHPDDLYGAVPTPDREDPPTHPYDLYGAVTTPDREDPPIHPDDLYGAVTTLEMADPPTHLDDLKGAVTTPEMADPPTHPDDLKGAVTTPEMADPPTHPDDLYGAVTSPDREDPPTHPDDLYGAVPTPDREDPPTHPYDLYGAVTTPDREDPPTHLYDLYGAVTTPDREDPPTHPDDLYGAVTTLEMADPPTHLDDLKGAVTTPEMADPPTHPDDLKGAVTTPEMADPPTHHDDLKGTVTTPDREDPPTHSDDLKGAVTTPEMADPSAGIEYPTDQHVRKPSTDINQTENLRFLDTGRLKDDPRRLDGATSGEPRADDLANTETPDMFPVTRLENGRNMTNDNSLFLSGDDTRRDDFVRVSETAPLNGETSSPQTGHTLTHAFMTFSTRARLEGMGGIGLATENIRFEDSAVPPTDEKISFDNSRNLPSQRRVNMGASETSAHAWVQGNMFETSRARDVTTDDWGTKAAPTERQLVSESGGKVQATEELYQRETKVRTRDKGTAEPSTRDTGTAEPSTRDKDTAEPSTRDIGTAEPSTRDTGTAEPSTRDKGTAEPSTGDNGTAKPSTRDKGTAEPSTRDKGTAEPSTGDNGTAKPSTRDKGTAEPSSGDNGTAQPSTRDKGTVEPSTRDKGTVEPSTRDKGTAEPSTRDKGTAEPSTGDNGTVEPSTVDKSTATPRTRDNGKVEPSTGDNGTVEPSTRDNGRVEPSTGDNGKVEPSTVDNGTVDPSTGDNGNVEPSTVDNGRVQPSTVDKGTAKPSTKDNGKVEPSTGDNGKVEPSSGDNGKVEPSTADNGKVEPISGDNGKVEPSTTDNGKVEPSTADNGKVEPSTADNGKVEPSTAANGRVQPSTVDKGTAKPSTKDNGKVEPSTGDNKKVEPRTGDNGKVEPSTGDNGTQEARTSGNDRAEDMRSEPASDGSYTTSQKSILRNIKTLTHSDMDTLAGDRNTNTPHDAPNSQAVATQSHTALSVLCSKCRQTSTSFSEVKDRESENVFTNVRLPGSSTSSADNSNNNMSSSDLSLSSSTAPSMSKREDIAISPEDSKGGFIRATITQHQPRPASTPSQTSQVGLATSSETSQVGLAPLTQTSKVGLATPSQTSQVGLAPSYIPSGVDLPTASRPTSVDISQQYNTLKTYFISTFFADLKPVTTTSTQSSETTTTSGSTSDAMSSAILTTSSLSSAPTATQMRYTTNFAEVSIRQMPETVRGQETFSQRESTRTHTLEAAVTSEKMSHTPSTLETPQAAHRTARRTTISTSRHATTKPPASGSASASVTTKVWREMSTSPPQTPATTTSPPQTPTTTTSPPQTPATTTSPPQTPTTTTSPPQTPTTTTSPPQTPTTTTSPPQTPATTTSPPQTPTTTTSPPQTPATTTSPPQTPTTTTAPSTPKTEWSRPIATTVGKTTWKPATAAPSKLTTSPVATPAWKPATTAPYKLTTSPTVTTTWKPATTTPSKLTTSPVATPAWKPATTAPYKLTTSPTVTTTWKPATTTPSKLTTSPVATPAWKPATTAPYKLTTSPTVTTTWKPATTAPSKLTTSPTVTTTWKPATTTPSKLTTSPVATPAWKPATTAPYKLTTSPTVTTTWKPATTTPSKLTTSPVATPAWKPATTAPYKLTTSPTVTTTWKPATTAPSKLTTSPVATPAWKPATTAPSKLTTSPVATPAWKPATTAPSKLTTSPTATPAWKPATAAPSKLTTSPTATPAWKPATAAPSKLTTPLKSSTTTPTTTSRNTTIVVPLQATTTLRPSTPSVASTTTPTTTTPTTTTSFQFTTEKTSTTSPARQTTTATTTTTHTPDLTTTTTTLSPPPPPALELDDLCHLPREPDSDPCSARVPYSACHLGACRCVWPRHAKDSQCLEYSLTDPQVGASNVTDNSLTVTWSHSPITDVRSVTYRVSWQTSLTENQVAPSRSLWRADRNLSLPVSVPMLTSNMYIIGNLTPGCEYTVAVTAVLASPLGQGHDLHLDLPIVVVTTVPSRVQQFNWSLGSDHNTMTLTFAKPQGHYDRCTIVVYKMTLSGDIESSSKHSWVSDCLTFDLSPYEPGIRYQIDVAVISGKISGLVSTFNLTVPATEPGPVTDLLWETAWNFVKLSWKPPRHPGGYITGYDLRLYSGGECSKQVLLSSPRTPKDGGGLSSHDEKTARECGPPETGHLGQDQHGSLMTYKFTDLDPGGQYTVHVFAENGVLKGQASSVAFTARSAVPKLPWGVRSETITSSQILVAWNSPPEYPGPTEYRIQVVQYRSRQKDDHQLVKDLTVNGYNTTKCLVTDLLPYNSYWFNISAVTSAGQSSPVRLGPVMTSERTSDPVKNLQVSETTTHSVDLMWAHPKNVNGRLLAYVIFIRDHNSLGECEQVITVSVKKGVVTVNQTFCAQEKHIQANVKVTYPQTTMTYHVSNLNPDTSYGISVAAYNGAGLGQMARVTVSTQIAVPSIPHGLTCSYPGRGMITFSWDGPAVRAGPTNYLVVVKEWIHASDLPLGFHVVANFSVAESSNRSIIMRKLKDFWLYSFSVAASTAAGSSETVTLSPPCQTPSAAPGPVQDLHILSVDVNSALVKWDCPREENRHGLLEEFHIYQKPRVFNRFDLDPNSVQDQVFKVGAGTKPCSWPYNMSLTVVPEVTYIFQVQAKVIEVDLLGETQPQVFTAPAAVPVPVPVFAMPTSEPYTDESSFAETTFSLNVCATCLLDNSHGQVLAFGILVCQEGHCDQSLGDLQDWKGVYAGVATWKTAQSRHFETLYRVTNSSWELAVKAGAAASEGTDVIFEVGNDTSCNHRPANVFCNGPVPPGKSFRVRLFSCTSAGCTVSESSGLFMTAESNSQPSSDVVVIGGAAAGVAVAVVVIAVVVGVRLKFRDPKVKGQAWSSSRRHQDVSQVVVLKDLSGYSGDYSGRPIKILEFEKRLKELHMNDNYLLSQEYVDLNLQSPLHSTDVGSDLIYRHDNRWTNILPYDHSRVKLAAVSGDETCSHDYINANYISGVSSNRDYIATQGPLTRTVPDFWRMVWEQRVSVVVMLSDFEELDKRTQMMREKVAHYFPQDERADTCQFGLFQVTRTRTADSKDWQIRDLRLTNTRTRKTRLVKHFFFKRWSDHEADIRPADLLDFIEILRAETSTPRQVAPLVVHCSAGVGRTGTFIAVDCFYKLLTSLRQTSDKSGLDAALLGRPVDIFGRVLNMRNSRRFMVQTMIQYVFIYDAIQHILQRVLHYMPPHDISSTDKELSLPPGRTSCLAAVEDDMYDDVAQLQGQVSADRGWQTSAT